MSEASTATATDAPKPFNAKAWAGERASVPKQDFSAAWKLDTEPRTEAPKGQAPPAPDAPNPETGTGDGGESPGVNKGTREEGARTMLAMYDLLMGQVCEGIVGDPERYPAQKFHLKDSLRADAVKHLAVGLDKMNMGDLPWWVPLVIIVGMGGFANWQLIRKAEREKQQRAKPAAPIAPPPFNVPHQATPPAAGAHPQAPPPPPPMLKVEKPRTGPQCSECTNQCNRGRVTCSQACAAKRTHRLRKQAKTAANTITIVNATETHEQ